MRVLLADDHPLFRAGLRPVLDKLAPRVELAEATDYPSAFDRAHHLRQLPGGLDLALLDLYMPGMQGTDGIMRFRAAYPDIPVVVVSASEEPDDMRQLLAAGALGYLTKAASSEMILNALRLVLAGGVYVPPGLLPAAPAPASPALPGRAGSLTARQVEVLQQLAKGLSNKQIATALAVTEGTVKIHLASVFRILRVQNRTEAVLVAQQMGLHKR